MKRFITHKMVALLGGLLLATAAQAMPSQWVHELLTYLSLQGPVVIDPGLGNKNRNGRDNLNLQDGVIPCPVVIDPGLGNKNRHNR